MFAGYVHGLIPEPSRFITEQLGGGRWGRWRGSRSAPYLDVTDSIRLGKAMEGLHTAARANKDLDQLSKVGATDLDHVLQRALLWNGAQTHAIMDRILHVVSACRAPCPSSSFLHAGPRQTS